MRTTATLPDDLMHRAKLKAQAEKRTLTDVIEEGVRQVVDHVSQRHRVLPCVSSAKGGVLVDLSNNAAIQDILDEGLPIEKLR